jgi:heme/copper-type cytochrome/quinol oxidase subunit 3
VGDDPDGDRDDGVVLAQAQGAEHRMSATPTPDEGLEVDIAGLPDFIFGTGSMGFWGVVAFILIEGMGFALAIGAYFYLMPYEHEWPPTVSPPPLFWATAGVLVAIASEIPSVLSSRRAKQFDVAATRVHLVWMTVFGVVLLALRALEFHFFNARWDANAYASICWALLIMHVLDLITDVWECGVLSAMFFTQPIDGRKLSDVEDNADFWHFVVATWVLIYVLVYWVPRWTQ